MKKNIFLIIVFLLLAYLCFLPKKNVSASKNNQPDIILRDLQDKIGPDFQYSLDQNTGKTTSISNKNNTLPLSLEGIDKNDAVSISNQFMKEYGSFFGIADTEKEISLFKKDVDSLGITNLRYGQKYKDVPVFGGQLIVHLGKDKNVNSANGKIIPDISLDTSAKISEQEAVEKAKELWKEQKRPDDPETLKTNLYIFNKSLFQNKPDDTKNYLVWEVNLYKDRPIAHEYYYIDAKNGKLVYQITGMQSAIHRHIYDCSYGDGNCYMDALDPIFGYIYGRSEGQPARGSQPILGLSDTDDLYDRTGNNFTYYESNFSRNGANNYGGMGDGSTTYPTASTTGLTFIDYFLGEGQNCPNSWFNGTNSIHFCKGQTTHDITGHEYAHAVNYFSILDGYGDPEGLTYSGQPGALNESNSDVFGTALENYSEGGAGDWLFGEDSLEGASRDMSLPSNKTYNLGSGDIPYPNKFHDSNYYCGTADNNGVHFNSSVPNHAAYLMAIGGTYNGCAITSIGRTKEEAIFYRAQTVYYTPSTDFNEAYNNLISACGDLYGGTDSSDCKNVKKALQSVEMDQSGYCSGLPEAVPECAPTSVYRFFNKIKGNHFYTQNEGEKDNIIATLSNEWNYEGIAYSAYSTQAANTSPLYRFWNKNTGFHFYTQNEGEKDNIIATLSDIWNYEGIAYYTYSTSQPNTTAVYRFFNKIQGNHFYTTSATEKDNIIDTLSATWNYEGIAWYANS